MRVPFFCLAFGAALALTGCSLTSDHFSCAVSTNNQLVRCVDYEQVGIQFRVTVETLCRGIGGNFSVDMTCPQENKLGGCKTEGQGYIQTSWYYPDSVAKTPTEVEGRCQGKEYFVDPTGARKATADMSASGMDR
ncbi:MAG: hypothetical protein U1A78_28140 [Polyangia bacterium]